MRWTRGESSGAVPGRWTRIAGLCCLILLPAFTPAAQAELARQDADVTMGYACRLPSGPKQVTVRVKASFPARTEPSAAIQPSDAAVTVTFPRDAAGEVLGPDAATVAGTARLGVLATQAGRPVGTEWTGLPIAGTGASRPMRITAAGPVPSSTAGPQGDVTFSAGALVLRLDIRKSDGTPTAAVPVVLECMPNLGQPTSLVTVPLVGDPAQGDPAQGGPGARAAQAPGTGAPGGSAGAPRTLADDFCPPPPPNRFNEKLVDLFPPIPPGSLPIVQGGGDRHCGLVDGRSNVNKLKGASPVRGMASVLTTVEDWFHLTPPRYRQTRSVARTDLIATEATFLTFGFMPTTAKMEITQIDNMNIAAETGDVIGTGITLTSAWAEVSIRIFDVRVNGTPLDVGPNCRTVRSVPLVLTGRSDGETPYNLNTGGELTGTVDIPPFTGCGTGGDDLDRLLTASISAPDNFLRLLQGTLCDPALPDQFNPCPPGAYGFTITPGGEFRATLAETSAAIINLGGDPINSPRITCGTSTITGTLRSGREIPPERLGQVTGFGLAECAGDGTLAGHRFTISTTGLPVTLAQNPAQGALPETGDVDLQFSVPDLRVASDFCSVHIIPAGRNATAVTVNMSYNMINDRLTLTGITGDLDNPSAGCPSGFVEVLSPFPFYEGIDGERAQDFKLGGPLPQLP